MKLFILSAILAVFPVLANAQMGAPSRIISTGDTLSSLSPIPVFPVNSILFPTAFRWNRNGPTGGYWEEDHVDDHIFRPVCRNVAKYNLKIYNRNGVLVYESSDIHKGWDGYLDNGNLAYQGVYIWQVTGIYSDGTTYSKKGDVTFIY
ncbi:MAG TPA: gliding motility-associated C-terminal domain-containing protein [Bacteroidales bacterium]|nr:gliding motility-associated C-terminal domain-containing protein [Bacteroidales bacterium]